MTDYNELWKMMEKYKSYFDQHSSSVDFQCIICNGLLNDAYQGPCGCLFCRKCVKNLLKNAGKYCPGTNSECRIEELKMGVNIHKDNNTNRKISKLQMKCFSNSCDYQNSLINICDHLKMCNHGSISCPYKDIGCTGSFLINNDLTDHLQSCCHYHNKLMIEWVLFVKSDLLVSMKLLKEEIVENKLDNFDQFLETKISQSLLNSSKETERKQAVTEEVQRTKFAKFYKETTTAIEKQNEQISKLKNDSISENIMNKLETDLVKIKNENKIVIDQIKDDRKKDLSQVYQFLQVELEIFKQEIFGKNQNKTMTSCNIQNEVEILQQSKEKFSRIAYLEWNIPGLSDIRSNRKTALSDFFYSNNREYKMRLMLDPTISQDGTRMGILLYIDNGNKNAEASWPFNGSAIVSIKNKTNSSAGQTISKYLKIQKPTTLFDVPKLFYFVNCDLEQDGVFQNDLIMIECSVSSIV